MYTTEASGGDLIIRGTDYFDIPTIFNCGQCFRFSENRGIYEGVAFGKLLQIVQSGNTVTLKSCTPGEFDDIWRHYLALDLDYGKINEYYADGADKTLADAAKHAKGIRILRQEPWEALCSFIVSQNNNIPRIKKIISSMCEAYGNAFSTCGRVFYTFPSPERLAQLTTDELSAVGLGFRNRYISDAAKKVAGGEIDLSSVFTMSTEEATAYLSRIKGVGLKVASCALLFGFDKRDAFPVDVWMKRLITEYYPDGLNIASLGENAGIAQQYLFHCERLSLLCR